MHRESIDRNDEPETPRHCSTNGGIRPKDQWQAVVGASSAPMGSSATYSSTLHLGGYKRVRNPYAPEHQGPINESGRSRTFLNDNEESLSHSLHGVAKMQRLEQGSTTRCRRSAGALEDSFVNTSSVVLEQINARLSQQEKQAAAYQEKMTASLKENHDKLVELRMSVASLQKDLQMLQEAQGQMLSKQEKSITETNAKLISLERVYSDIKGSVESCTRSTSKLEGKVETLSTISISAPPSGVGQMTMETRDRLPVAVEGRAMAPPPSSNNDTSSASASALFGVPKASEVKPASAFGSFPFSTNSQPGAANQTPSTAGNATFGGSASTTTTMQTPEMGSTGTTAPFSFGSKPTSSDAKVAPEASEKEGNPFTFGRGLSSTDNSTSPLFGGASVSGSTATNSATAPETSGTGSTTVPTSMATPAAPSSSQSTSAGLFGVGQTSTSSVAPASALGQAGISLTGTGPNAGTTAFGAGSGTNTGGLSFGATGNTASASAGQPLSNPFSASSASVAPTPFSSGSTPFSFGASAGGSTFAPAAAATPASPAFGGTSSSTSSTFGTLASQGNGSTTAPATSNLFGQSSGGFAQPLSSQPTFGTVPAAGSSVLGTTRTKRLQKRY